MEPKTQDKIVAGIVNVRLFKIGILNSLKAVPKASKVGFIGICIGFEKIKASCVFKAVITALQRGRRVKNTKNMSKR